MRYNGDITCRGVVLAIILAALLSSPNAFLALKLGLLTSASILLRLFLWDTGVFYKAQLF